MLDDATLDTHLDIRGAVRGVAGPAGVTKIRLARARYPGGVQNQPICLIISAPRGGVKNTHF